MGAVPQIADWDEDGDIDLIVGDRNGVIWLFTNVGSSTAPQLATGVKIQANGTALDVGSNSCPVVVDWNNDGKKDLVIGTENYQVRVYLNSGTNAAPSFTSHTVVLTNSSTMYRCSPEVYDLNNDGKKDLIVGEHYGKVMFYENIGTDAAPSFSNNGVQLQFSNGSPFQHSANGVHIDLVDWDGNGTRDLLVGDYNANMTLYLNNSPTTVMTTTSHDLIADNTAPANFTAYLKNGGSNTETFNIDVISNGPVSWTTQFTTANGTFPAGTTDALQIPAGDSAAISIEVNPNATDGFCQTKLSFNSQANPNISGEKTFRNITETGFQVLVLEGSAEHSDSLFASLDRVSGLAKGMVSKDALQSANLDLSNFEVVAWTAGDNLPVFNPGDDVKLQNYMDNGGNLFICGQDIGSDIFEASGQSQFAQSFYHNYLHADYQSDASTWFLVRGVSGDPIGNGIQFIINDVYPKSPDIILPYDGYASPILKFFNGPELSGIKAVTNTHRTVYITVGMEQITDRAVRDSVVYRSINWLREIITDITGDNNVISEFVLEQNYPNPFNPTTIIPYQIPVNSHVKIAVYDLLGQKVRTLANLKQSAGLHHVIWDGLNDSGISVSAGLYFYRLEADGFNEMKKMLLVK